MPEDQDVRSPVPAEDSVGEGVASPDTGEGQEHAAMSDKEYNFRSLEADRDKYRKETEDLRTRAQESENLVSMYKAMGYQQPQAQGQQPSQQPMPQQQSFGGLDFGDAVDSEAFNKLTGYIGQQAEQITQQTKMQAEQMEQMELRMHDPNWRATIDNYLPDAIREDPSIAETIKASPKPWKSAYHFASRTEPYMKNKMAGQQSREAEKMVENAKKPKSLGTTGPQSNVGGHRDAFDMSKEEFEAVKKKLVEGRYQV